MSDRTEPRDVALLTELVALQHALLAGDGDVDAVAAEIAARAHRLTGADGAVVEMLEGEELVYRAAAGAAARFTGMRMNAATSLSRRPLQSGDVLWSQDAGADRRVAGAREGGARSLVIVPLVPRRNPTGTLKAYASRPHAFGERDVRVIQLLASFLAGVLARADLAERIERASASDRLTGLPNRRAWDERAPRELARAARSGNPVCLALIDLDHFHAFNAANGSAAGDGLLKSCAARWSSRIRSVDLLSRLGGEEFGLLLPNCIAPDALVAVERVRAATRDLCAVSVGVAQWDMQEPLESLMLRADVALYTAKKSGRDRVVLADAGDSHAEESPAGLDFV